MSNLVIPSLDTSLSFNYGVEAYKCIQVEADGSTISVTMSDGALTAQFRERFIEARQKLDGTDPQVQVPDLSYRRDLWFEAMSCMFKYKGCVPVSYKMERGMYTFKFAYDYRDTQ